MRLPPDDDRRIDAESQRLGIALIIGHIGNLPIGEPSNREFLLAAGERHIVFTT